MQVKFEDEERDDERSIRIRRSTQWQLTNARNVAFVLLLLLLLLLLLQHFNFFCKF